MSTIVDILFEIAPELAVEPLHRVDTFIGLAAARISASVFGKVYPQAVAYLTAHLMSVSARAQSSGAGGAAGPVTSASTGGVSVSYGQATAHVSLADSALSTTAYGLEYLALRNSRPGTKMRIVRA